MFIYNQFIINYHFSGTLIKPGMSPASLIIWKIIEWAKSKDIRWLNLGGGVSQEDSLFQFKKNFSNLDLPFYIGKRIINKDIYKKLTNLNSNSTQAKEFFPQYRYGLDSQII